MALGKALGGGVPIGAALFQRARRRAASPSATTAARTAATCWPAAPRWCSSRSCRSRADRARGGGRRAARSALRRWPRGTRPSVEVRGAGLIWGLELDRPAAPVVEAALEPGCWSTARPTRWSGCCRRTSSTRQRWTDGCGCWTRHWRPLWERRADERDFCELLRRRMRRRFTADRGQPRGGPSAAALESRTSASTSRGSSSPSSTARSSAAPSWRRSARRWPKCARWSWTSRCAGSTSAPGSWRTSRRTAPRRGYSTLCAFTHEPSHFVRLGFTIVPHIWVPEKIAHDCNGCALFRKCGQYAVRLPLRAGREGSAGAARRDDSRPRRGAAALRTSSGCSSRRCDDESSEGSTRSRSSHDRDRDADD